MTFARFIRVNILRIFFSHTLILSQQCSFCKPSRTRLDILYICGIIRRMTMADRFYSAQDKIAAYDQETKNLMLDAMDFSDAISEHFTLPEIVYLLRESFKKPATYPRVFQEARIDPDADPASGFCIVSSYLIYNMTGGNKVWKIYHTPLHWWLYHKQSHTIFDITHTQFSDKYVHQLYNLGQPVPLSEFDRILKSKAKDLAKQAGLR